METHMIKVKGSFRKCSFESVIDTQVKSVKQVDLHTVSYEGHGIFIVYTERFGKRIKTFIPYQNLLFFEEWSEEREQVIRNEPK